MVYLNTENTRAILPIALILFLMTSLRALPAPPEIKGEKINKETHLKKLSLNARFKEKRTFKCVITFRHELIITTYI